MGVDLVGVDLMGVDLVGVDLVGVDLVGVDLVGMNPSLGVFSYAKLTSTLHGFSPAKSWGGA